MNAQRGDYSGICGSTKEEDEVKRRLESAIKKYKQNRIRDLECLNVKVFIDVENEQIRSGVCEQLEAEGYKLVRKLGTIELCWPDAVLPSRK